MPPSYKSAPVRLLLSAPVCHAVDASDNDRRRNSGQTSQGRTQDTDTEHLQLGDKNGEKNE